MECLMYEHGGYRFSLAEKEMADGNVRLVLRIRFGGIEHDLLGDDPVPGLRQSLPASIFVRDWASQPLRTPSEYAMARQFLEGE